MAVMMCLGSILLKDVFTCEGCLWFSVGTEQDPSASTAMSSWNASNKETAQASLSAYTGTVKEALGLNSYQMPQSDIAEGCGVWVLHPHKWEEQPGKQIEFDVTVGSTPVVIEQGAAVATDGTLSVAPLTDPTISSSCKVSLGSDGMLRNFNQDNKVISVGNCNRVSYLSDSSSNPNAIAYKGRKAFGVVGLVVFFLIRAIQYFILFSGLGSKKEVERKDEEAGFWEERCITYSGRFWKWCMATFEFTFFSEFPGLVLLPLNALDFHEGCDQILTFRFNATLWMVGTVVAVFGAIFHSVDALLPVVNTDRNKFTQVKWPRVMFGVGVVLTLFIYSLKILYIMRMGFTFLLGFKLEWAFKFQFWPITQAICLDLFQLSAFCYFIFDKFFAAFVGYLKYYASDEMKRKQAGKLGKMFSKEAEICQMKYCKKCKKVLTQVYRCNDWCKCGTQQDDTDKEYTGEFEICGGQLVWSRGSYSTYCDKCGKIEGSANDQADTIKAQSKYEITLEQNRKKHLDEEISRAQQGGIENPVIGRAVAADSA